MGAFLQKPYRKRSICNIYITTEQCAKIKISKLKRLIIIRILYIALSGWLYCTCDILVILIETIEPEIKCMHRYAIKILFLRILIWPIRRYGGHILLCRLYK